jgi:hypothetical protein
MMRRTMILALAIAGCNGGGESTTAAETVADTGSTGTPMTDTDTPMTDTGTPMTETGTPMTETGEPETTDTTAADTTAGEESSGGTTTGDCPEVGIVGTWLSEGGNVAPLLVNVLNLVSIEAIFDELTFEVNSTDADGAMGQQVGTWTSELCPGSETKYLITLDQTSPSAITVEGIYEIDGCENPAVMRYEVIQTQPDLGSAAPTCDDDFGTGDFGADNIQIFVRQ